MSARVTIRALSVTIVLFAGVSLAQDAPTDASQVIGQIVQGIVLEVGTDRPLQGVQVYLEPPSASPFKFGDSTAKNGISDSQGRFAISEVLPGRYRAVPTLDGFVYATSGNNTTPREPGAWIQIESGERNSQLQIRMAKSGVISGRVMDSNGQPVVGTTVEIDRYSYDNYGIRKLAAVPGLHYPEAAFSFVRTDDRGTYRLYGLQPGEYFLRTSQLFYPGVSEEAGAASIHIQSGDEIQLDAITLRPKAPTTQVRFQLTNSPADTFERDVAFDTGNTYITFPDSTESPFTIPSPQGHIGAMVIAAGSNQLSYARVEFQVENNPMEQNVELHPAIRITGSILGEEIAGQRLAFPKVTCNLHANRPTRSIATSGCIGGQYLPGTYDLELQGMPADAYVISAEISGKDALASRIQLEKDSELNIVIGTSGGMIKGVVKNSAGEAIPEAIVAILPDPPRRTAGLLYRSVTADNNGNFELRGVAPGEYHLFSWIALPGAAYRNADFMKTYEDRGTAIRIERGSQLVINTVLVDEPVPPPISK
jgi:hypothetical protein